MKKTLTAATIAFLLQATGAFASITSDSKGVTATVTRGADAVIFYAGRLFINRLPVSSQVYHAVIVSDSDRDGVVHYDVNPPADGFLRWFVVDMSNGTVETDGIGVALPTPAIITQKGWDGLISRLSVPNIGYGPVVWVRPGVGAWMRTQADGSLADDDGLYNGRIGIAVSSMAPLSGGPDPPQAIESGDIVIAVRIDDVKYFVKTVDLVPKSGPGTFFAQVERSKAVEGAVVPLIITREGGSDGAVSLAYDTPSPGSGIIFERTTGTLEFAPGETTKTISIPTIDNAAYSGYPSIRVTLTGNGAAADSTFADIDLADDEPPPTLTLLDATVAEGGDGTQYATMTVTLTGPTTVPATVNWVALGYGSLNTLTVLPGQTAQTIRIAYPGNTTVNGDVVIDVKLLFPQYCVLARTSATLTIRDDDPPPPPPPPRHRAARH